jgi:hypothetical protein
VSVFDYSPTRRFAKFAALLTVALAIAPPASASPETLKRSTSNILFAPLDVVLSPVVAGQIIYTNLREIDDSRWVRIAYPVPGYVWILGVELGASILREVTGLIELLPGIGLLFFDADLDPLYHPVERGDALVDEETKLLNVKFGVDYISVPSD